MTALLLTGDGLTVADVVAVARGRRRVELAAEALRRMTDARALAERALAAGEPVYGLTTGYGARRSLVLDAAGSERYARATVDAHRAAAHGPPVAADVVRAAALHRANGLARGGSLARPAVAEALVDLLNDGDAPPVRALGSVGQADLPAMADLAAALVARGLELGAGDALALLDANSLAVGHGALALADAGALLDGLDAAAALSLEAFGANLALLHPAVARERPYPGLRAAVERLRALLAGSALWEAGAARSLQDPLSFRCIPQVHGAARDALAYAVAQVEIELNAAADNPLVVREEGRTVATGSFDVLPVAAALDLVRLAFAPVVTLTSERVQKHLWTAFSGLPTGLRAGEEDDALALVGGGAAALAGEARLLAAPVSYEVATSSIAAGIEDHVTMAPLAARRLEELARLAARVGAVELVVAAQAAELRPPAARGAGTAAVLAGVRRRVPFVAAGASPAHDLDDLTAWVAAGAPTE
jgi:histidine ammonia-lyase